MIPFLDALAERFTSAPEEERQAYIRKYLACVAVIVIEPEHITGKEGSLPAEARRKAARPEPVPANGGGKDTAALLEDGRKRAGAVAALAESLSWRVKFRDDPEKKNSSASSGKTRPSRSARRRPPNRRPGASPEKSCRLPGQTRRGGSGPRRHRPPCRPRPRGRIQRPEQTGDPRRIKRK